MGGRVDDEKFDYKGFDGKSTNLSVSPFLRKIRKIGIETG